MHNPLAGWIGSLIALLSPAAAGPPADSPGLPPAHPTLFRAVPSAPRPAPKRARPRRKGPPVNAAYTRGLYTVGKQGRGLYYRKGKVLGVGVNVIEADLSDPEVRVAAMVAEGGIGTQEGFSRMMQRARPAAAITGTFFGMRSLIPTGDLVINGRPIFRGFIGTAVAITEGNLVSFIPTRYKDSSVDWSMFDTVIRGGPRLMDAGQVTMNARSEGFLSLPITQRRARTAVGVTWDNRLQFVAVRQGITMWEMAKLMRAIGAYNAVALDGGTSTALYFAGQQIAKPGRGLTNVLLLYHRRDRYEQMRSQFALGTAPLPRSTRPTVAGVSRPTGSH